MTPDLLPYAAVVLRLLRDVLYSEDKEWQTLLTYQAAVREYWGKVGLELNVDTAEGYAYLTQPEADPDDSQAPTLPRLISRHPLTYEATLLAVLLRERLQQFDAAHPEQTRLVLTSGEMQEMLALFFPERADATRVTRKLESVIKQVVDVGFLKPIGKKEEGQYEVKRIIKAKFPADKLAEIREMLLANLEEGE